jgi:hypothetical protein
MNASFECRVAPIGLSSGLAPIALVSASCTRDERLFGLWSIRFRGVVPPGQEPRASHRKEAPARIEKSIKRAYRIAWLSE